MDQRSPELGHKHLCEQTVACAKLLGHESDPCAKLLGHDSTTRNKNHAKTMKNQNMFGEDDPRMEGQTNRPESLHP